ncbi:MAG TPA: adenylate/guanylate cyclase domain-containing protein [Actinomycetes bacterium]|nr:adenylate/guanylate cyclase domain-containing protein [Actinomycetes bacterium]
MEVGAWLAAGGALVAILGAAFATMRWVLQKSVDAEREKLSAEREKLEAQFERRQLIEFRERWQQPGSGSTGELIQQEVSAELAYVMNALGATESSVLVPDPAPRSPYLVFLVIHGAAAPQIRKTKVGPDTTAAEVFRTGRVKILSDPYRDASFSSAVDKKGDHLTRNLLTIPLRDETAGRIVGVAQFLNKVDNQPFTEEDARIAMVQAASIAVKTTEFIRSPRNFEVLGFYAEPEQREATLLFCDLSASSSLFRVLDPPSAINCMDEYVTRQAAVILRLGGTIDKYLGDGAMFRFNVPLPIRDTDHAVRAAEAALEMRENFDVLKQSWLGLGWEVAPLFNRIGLACGGVYELAMGHPMQRQVVVMGETVGRAAHLCEAATRDRNVVLIDQATHKRLDERFITKPATDRIIAHPIGAYELLGLR